MPAPPPYNSSSRAKPARANIDTDPPGRPPARPARSESPTRQHTASIDVEPAPAPTLLHFPSRISDTAAKTPPTLSRPAHKTHPAKPSPPKQTPPPRRSPPRRQTRRTKTNKPTTASANSVPAPP